MGLEEYFKYSIFKGYLGELKWVISMFTTTLKDTEYVKIINNKRYVIVNDENVELPQTEGVPLYRWNDVVTLTNNNLKNINDSVETTYGIAFSNYILLTIGLKNKIPFINGYVDIKKIEATVIENMVEIDEATESDITVDDLERLSKTVGYMIELSDFVVYSITEKTLLPPPDLDEVKKKTLEEIIKKHGKDSMKDPLVYLEYELTIMDYYKDYIKDDPTYGIVTSGNKIDVSAKKRFVGYGLELGLGTRYNVIQNSLMDGWDLGDKEQVSALFNSARAASFLRGKETEITGVTAKSILSATHNFKNVPGDCGVTYGYDIELSEGNIKHQIGRYIIINGKSILIKDETVIEKYIGKTIEIRSYTACKSPGDTYCSVCVGKKASRYVFGPIIMGIGTAGVFLNQKMKAMHGRNYELYTTSLEDFFG